MEPVGVMCLFVIGPLLSFLLTKFIRLIQDCLRIQVSASKVSYNGLKYRSSPLSQEVRRQSNYSCSIWGLPSHLCCLKLKLWGLDNLHDLLSCDQYCYIWIQLIPLHRCSQNFPMMKLYLFFLLAFCISFCTMGLTISPS